MKVIFMRMTQFSILLMVLLSGFESFAGPAFQGVVSLVQPDGAELKARYRGDEFQNWTELASTGHTIIKSQISGFWEYARIAPDESLTSTGITALNSGSNAPESLQTGLRPPRNEKMYQQMNLIIQENYKQRLFRTSSTVTGRQLSIANPWIPVPVSGPRKMILILVSFADRTLITTPSDWNSSVFNEANLSVAKYYKDNSFGSMTISPVAHTQSGSPAGVISVAITDNHPNTSDATALQDQTWANNALIEAKKYVNFDSYDVNSDGKLDTSEIVIYFIAAGYEASAGTNLTPAVWAHAWNSDADLTAGTKTVINWSQNGEFYNTGIQMPIGVIAHELGHQLGGLPDLYDVSKKNQGMGIFSLMASGSWGANIGETSGLRPTLLDAWSREYLGWASPTLPTPGPLSINEPLSAVSAPVKLIKPVVSTTEYFLLENRNPSGWDLGLKETLGASWTGGLLITHIDIAAGTVTANNDINSYAENLKATSGNNKQGVVPVQASSATCDMLKVPATASCWGDVTTLFFNTNNATWNSTSTPDTSYYNGNASGFALTGISAPGATMTATLGYSQPPPTAITDAAFVTTTTATLNGTVSSNGASTTVTFNYGLTAAYGNTLTADQSPLAAGASVSAVFADISGLTCNTTYHFRVVGVNSAGTTNGSDATFTTSVCSSASTLLDYIGKHGTIFTVKRIEPNGTETTIYTGGSTSYTDTTAPLSNTIYRYTVSSDTEGATDIVTIRTPLYNGWNILGVPYDTTGIAISTLFSSSVSSAYEWVPSSSTDPDNSGQYNVVTTLTPGKGYFVRTGNSSTMLTHTGIANAATVNVTLKPGWTLISNPYTTNKTAIGTNWLISGLGTLDAAVTASKIGGDVYWWNGSTYDSWKITDLTIPANSAVIEPWKAYWILNMDTINHTLTM